MKRSHVAAALILAVAGVTKSAAQESRGPVIEAARAATNEFDNPRALDLYVAAANPLGDPQDSLWAVAVFDLAQLLHELDNADLAGVWLRWMRRHGPEWTMDRTDYLPTVVEAYDDAAANVEPDLAGELAATSWGWPSGFQANAPGTLEVRSSAEGASVRVDGVTVPRDSPALELRAGTYPVVVSADGYETLTLSREVLPGTATLVDVTLPPLFSAEAERRARQWIVRVDRTVGGQLRCGTGFVADGGELVVTTVSTAGAAGLVDVLAFEEQERHQSATVAASNPVRNVAVIRIEGRGEGIPAGATPETERPFAWVLYYPSCGTPVTERVRVIDRAEDSGAIVLEGALPPAAAGAPLVDRGGGVLGVVTDGTSAVPISTLQGLLSDARDHQVTVASAGGGGVPTWLWLALGAGAAVGAVAALGGGGDSPPPPTGDTGGITITFPLGGN